MSEHEPLRDPGRIVVIAYLLAVTSILVPLALLGALFAGFALTTRGRRADGFGVIALGVACTALGVLLLR